MKIIKHGTPKDCLHFICNECCCEWLATKEEADKTPDVFLVEGDDGYVMTCPDCHNMFGRTIKSYGRLIDADALTKALKKRWNVDDDQDFANKSVWRELENAPTIIDAEDKQ